MSLDEVSMHDLIFCSETNDRFSQIHQGSFEKQMKTVLKRAHQCFVTVCDMCEEGKSGCRPRVFIAPNQFEIALEISTSARGLSLAIRRSLHRRREPGNDALLIQISPSWGDRRSTLIHCPPQGDLRFDDVCIKALKEFEERAIAALVHQRATTQWKEFRVSS